MEINLTGKIAVVTGATGELGRVMALTLAKCGADVAVHYHRNEEKAKELVEEICRLPTSTTPSYNTLGRRYSSRLPKTTKANSVPASCKMYSWQKRSFPS